MVEIFIQEIMVGIPEGEMSLERPRREWEDNNKLVLKK
jgi:hypothetical protein